MKKSREEQLQEAELRSKEASELYQEFVDWKHRVISFAKSEFYFSSMSKNWKEKAESPNNLISVLCGIVQKPLDLKSTFEYEDQQLAFKEKERKEKLRYAAQQNEEIKLTEEATIYLQEHGKILGKDFSLGTAIFVADNVAFELEKERMLNNKNYPFFSFSGNEYCDESCEGWDGVSHRCDCGNSRVDWEFDTGHSFKNPSIWPKAY